MLDIFLFLIVIWLLFTGTKDRGDLNALDERVQQLETEIHNRIRL